MNIIYTRNEQQVIGVLATAEVHYEDKEFPGETCCKELGYLTILGATVDSVEEIKDAINQQFGDAWTGIAITEFTPATLAATKDYDDEGESSYIGK